MFYRKVGRDVTGTILVRDSSKVESAVIELMQNAYTNFPVQKIRDAFYLFNNLYKGHEPNFHPCDMLYHDEEHVLDVTLATARLLFGLQQSSIQITKSIHRLDAQLALTTIITALFHDSGYLRRLTDPEVANGAVFTKYHVQRSSDNLYWIMPQLGMKPYTRIATQAVHYTGYEKAFKSLDLNSHAERLVGCIVATADYLAQMSDRCYLEKCYYRLFPEFVLGGINRKHNENENRYEVIYADQEELMRKTYAFYKNIVKPKLEIEFLGVYHYTDAIFPTFGINLYIWWVESNQRLLEGILKKEIGFNKMLKRKLPETRGVKTFPYHLIKELS